MWRRWPKPLDLIVDSAATFPNCSGPTSRAPPSQSKIALTASKPFTYVSTAERGCCDRAVGVHRTPTSGNQPLHRDGGWAGGYGTSKWAGEVLLRGPTTCARAGRGVSLRG